MSLLSPKTPWSVLLTAPEISAIDGDGNPIFSAKRKHGRELFEQFNDFLLIENAPKLLNHLRKVVDVMRRSDAGLSPSTEITNCTEDEWDAALNASSPPATAYALWNDSRAKASRPAR